MAHMNNQKRVAAGVPQGGQFAQSAKGEADVDLGATDGVARDILAAALARYDLDETLTGLDGRTITQAWDEKFAVLNEPEVASVDQVVYDLLGDDFEIGRHRGGPWLVWYDPNVSWRSDEDGQWASVTLDDFDEPNGRELAVEFHTRNGAGNRECYCPDDDHTDGKCTGAIVEDLQARPDHIHDEDDYGDPTYANFYFRLPHDPRLKQALAGKNESDKQYRARYLLHDIENGKKPLWDVFEVNLETEKAYQEVLNRPGERRPEKPHLRGEITVPYSPTPTDVAHLDAVIAVARNGEDEPDATGSYWEGHVRRPGDTAIRYGKEEQAAHEEAEKAREALAEVRSGRVPESVIELMGGVSRAESAAGLAERKWSNAKNLVEGAIRNLQQARGYLAEVVRVDTANRERQEALQRFAWAKRWPGPVDECPPEPENASSGW